jgi:hypothetical protein
MSQIRSEVFPKKSLFHVFEPDDQPDSPRTQVPGRLHHLGPMAEQPAEATHKSLQENAWCFFSEAPSEVRHLKRLLFPGGLVDSLQDAPDVTGPEHRLAGELLEQPFHLRSDQAPVLVDVAANHLLEFGPLP